MAQMMMDCILIGEVETKDIMTKSSLPVGGYSVNPYVGCTVKHWPEIKNPRKYAGQRVVIGSVTDGYNPQEEVFQNTRKLLEQLRGSGADILICTKSDLVVRDLDLLKELGQVTVSWSINTLDEAFKDDMDSAVSIERRLSAMKKVYDAGIRTVCFVSPVFPGITDFEAIFERVKDQCDLFWLENLNLRGGFKKTIMDYIAEKRPELVGLYDAIYNKKDRSYFEGLEARAEAMAKRLRQSATGASCDRGLFLSRGDPRLGEHGNTQKMICSEKSNHVIIDGCISRQKTRRTARQIVYIILDTFW